VRIILTGGMAIPAALGGQHGADRGRERRV
jgi:hypothetical protein